MQYNEFHFKITLEAMNHVGVMTRITNVLRKFSLNIYEFSGKTHPEDPERFTMYLWVAGPRENCDYIFKKLEKIIDVVKIEWKGVK
ncbi:MAG: ACT domain-containing protein [Patescibacteria group bacterium]